MRSFEEDLKQARLERVALLMDEVLRGLLKTEPEPLRGGLIYDPCYCEHYPCRHSEPAVFPLSYYR